MAKNTSKTLNVFIGCPGDMAPERDALLASRDHIESVVCPVKFRTWKMSASGVGEAQRVIFQNDPVADFDIVMILVWTRLGVPSGLFDPRTKAEMTGTEAEFATAYDLHESGGQQRPQVLLYRCVRNAEIDVNSPTLAEQLAQLQAVQRFFKQTETGGLRPMLAQSFKSADELTKVVERDIKTAAERLRASARKLAAPAAQLGRGAAPTGSDIAAARMAKEAKTGKVDAVSFSEFDTRLREAIRIQNNYLDLPGITLKDEEARNYELTVAYVALSLSATNSGKPEQSLRADKLLDGLPTKTPRLIVTGHAGCGKSTLLRWIAVTCATPRLAAIIDSAAAAVAEFRLDGKYLQSFATGKPPEVSEEVIPSKSPWVDKLPLLLRLRDYEAGKLPDPLGALQKVAPSSIPVPIQFFEDYLAKGRVIFLIDGVDEVPERFRTTLASEVRRWIEAYPACHYVITSRPDAVEAGWPGKLDFSHALVTDLSPADRSMFITHWHDAVAQRFEYTGKVRDMAQKAKRLEQQIIRNPPLGRLMTNPLLAAAICALHLGTDADLPQNDLEVCDKLVDMLLSRRAPHDQAVKPGQSVWHCYDMLTNSLGKIPILAGIATQMFEVGLSVLPEPDVNVIIAAHIATLPAGEASPPQDILRGFLTLSGLLRRGRGDGIEFIHNTFKELLAASRYALLDRKHLVERATHATDPIWMPVLRFTAMRAAPEPTKLNAFIAEIILRFPAPKTESATQSRARHGAHLLLMQIAAVVAMDRKLREQIDALRKGFIPPHTIADAQALASCGELAVPLLVGLHAESIGHRVAIIHALGTIGSPDALGELATYVNDPSTAVLAELARYLNPVTFPSVQEQLVLGRDLPAWCRREHVRDLQPLAGLAGLVSLNLNGCTGVTALEPLSNLDSLIFLSLNGCSEVSDLNPLAGSDSLKVLYLKGCSGVCDLKPLGDLASLETLVISGCTGVSNAAVAALKEKLPKLMIYGP